MSSEDEVVLEFSNVTKKFGGAGTVSSVASFLNRLKNFQFSSKHLAKTPPFVALDKVSFQIRRGEKVGFIGRNGCGKSTTLKLVQGVMNPTTGKINTKGDVGGLIELTAGFVGDLTAKENVYIGGALMGLDKEGVDAIIDDVFRLAELEKFKNTSFKNFSSGMKVRLGFCLAMATVPDIILLDEVLAVGDASFKDKSMKMVNNFLNNRTLLFVSHSMEQVRKICERVIVLEKGKVIYDGPTKGGIETYNDVVKGKTAVSQKPIVTRAAGANKRGESKKSPLEVGNLKCEIESSKNGERFLNCSVDFLHNYEMPGNSLRVELNRASIGELPLLIGGNLLPIPDDGLESTFKIDISKFLQGKYSISVSAYNKKNSKDCESKTLKHYFKIEHTKKGAQFGVVDLCIKQLASSQNQHPI